MPQGLKSNRASVIRNCRKLSANQLIPSYRCQISVCWVLTSGHKRQMNGIYFLHSHEHNRHIFLIFICNLASYENW